jgi:glutamine amidotransferase
MNRPFQVAIPALPIGNLAAVANMVCKCGGEAVITSNPLDLYRAQRIILAGVGTFDSGMQALEEGGWLAPLHDLALQGQTPILGICLGMQLMCQRSDEGVLPGLGWFKAQVKRILPAAGLGLKVPHMGWNTLNIRNANLTAAMGRGNLYGTQFHPEKSHRFGMTLMQHFLKLK